MIELLTPDEMASADREAIERLGDGLGLMECAGQAVADYAIAHYPADWHVLILCGPGNNGGDGFVAARLLAEQGRHVSLALFGEKESLTADAAHMAGLWGGDIHPLSYEFITSVLSKYSAQVLCIDALFGAGLSRPILGSLGQIIKTINQQQIPVISVDLPSGVDGGSGQILGLPEGILGQEGPHNSEQQGIAFQAEATISFFRRKPGHLLYPGRALCGALKIVDIGIPDDVLERVAPAHFANEPPLWRAYFPKPNWLSHKYNRGHAVIISGAEMTGAARLAARGSLRIGAGLVTIAAPPEAIIIHQAHLNAIMLMRCANSVQLEAVLSDQRKNVVLIGPGLGIDQNAQSLVVAALAAEQSVVLDADAITCCAQLGDAFFTQAQSRKGALVLTPHEGEFARLFPDLSGEANKITKAREAAKRSNAVIILKGADTLIADPGGRIAINHNAPPWLATAGSGDVLAGICAGLLAQGMPGFYAASAACWMHGAAAALFGPGLIAEDLPEMLPQLLSELLSEIPRQKSR